MVEGVLRVIQKIAAAGGFVAQLLRGISHAPAEIVDLLLVVEIGFEEFLLVVGQILGESAAENHLFRAEIRVLQEGHHQFEQLVGRNRVCDVRALHHVRRADRQIKSRDFRVRLLVPEETALRAPDLEQTIKICDEKNFLFNEI